MRCALLAVVHCVLCSVHSVWCFAVHCALPSVPCVLHTVVHCVLHSVVQCVLHPLVHCVVHPVVHSVLHCVAHCVPYSVLAVLAHRRGVVRGVLHTVLLVHPGAVHCLLFPVALHPPVPDVPALWEGGEFTIAMGAGSRAPLCQQGSRNAAENILQSRGGSPLWGRGGGGSSVAAGRGGLALHAHSDAGTTSRSGEGACRASRRGSSLRGRCERLSGAGIAADTGLPPPQPCREHTCPRLAGRRCQHPPARGSHKRPSTRVLTG